MLKPIEKKSFLNEEDLIAKIQLGYTIDLASKHTQKKTFAPSTLVYGHGECPRYWYLAFEGNVFDTYSDAYAVANMSAGTQGHDRIQNAMMKSGVAKIFKDDKGVDTTEFKVINQDPPMFGYGDAMILWDDQEIVGEIKTMMNEAWEYRKTSGKPKTGHLVQLLFYMKILKKARGVLIYENKNNHQLLIFPVEINDLYRNWVDYAFDWMREVRKAWENKTLPTKNYRSNSKICKTCPVKVACGNAEVGSIKIASLEELSETM